MKQRLKNQSGFLILTTVLFFAHSFSASAAEISSAEGKKLFYLERTHSNGEKVSCTLCHTNDPKQPGKTRANKIIEPLAPIANAKRFTDEAKVEKWFNRNCKDVLERLCTPEEKESFILYMKSIK